jgi:predicted acetyltransferase
MPADRQTALMDVEYRPISGDQFDAFARVSRIAFGQEPFAADAPFSFGRSELERTRAAFVGDEIVGSGRNFSLELTVPGGAIVPASGVSWIAVLPSHRRRGVLAGMMTALYDDSVDHGEALSVLTASEGGIYDRFGYGVATWRMSFHVERAHGAFLAPIADDGQIRYVERAEALECFPAVYSAACRLRPGMVSRPDAWWDESLYHFVPPTKAGFFVVHETADGTVDGFVVYEIEGDFSNGINQSRLRVFDIVALTAATRALLWQFVLSVDLVQEISAAQIAVDDPLRFLLADVRRLRVDAVNDQLWVQIVDIERALEARRYSTTDRLVLEVHAGSTVARVALDGGPEAAQCRATTASPDLVLGQAQLGSIYLGGVRAEQHAAAGTIEESTPGAVARLDAMFASYPSPATPTWF